MKRNKISAIRSQFILELYRQCCGVTYLIKFEVLVFFFFFSYNSRIKRIICKSKSKPKNEFVPIIIFHAVQTAHFSFTPSLKKPEGSATILDFFPLFKYIRRGSICLRLYVNFLLIFYKTLTSSYAS